MAAMTDKPNTETTVQEPSSITEATAPFDDVDADVILRSSDNVDFRVFKLLLSMSSPFFKDMFSLPQGAKMVVDGGGETKDELPVVPVSETAKILRLLLSMCYPLSATKQPALDDIEDVELLLDATIKYSCEGVEKRVSEALVTPHLLRDNPVRVFTIACRHKMDAEARAAAKATLLQPSILEGPCGPSIQLHDGRAECRRRFVVVSTGPSKCSTSTVLCVLQENE
ncbi:hypothetical protein HWV62_11457 [Athelia sp. TMB]|nr:hypothetical protein HWV62_11457 [Athelia sp. TMB]